MSHTKELHYERRAATLRRFAEQLVALHALTLSNLAGPTTWTGSRPFDLLNAYRTRLDRIAREAEDLQSSARYLDRLAQEQRDLALLDAAGAR